MRNCVSRRVFLASSVLSGAGLLAGCGTILHPERRGQPAGTLDPGVVLLDGIGLLLFFIPGVIAFAVDFSTGAIYLPPAEGERLSQGQPSQKFRTRKIAASKLTRAEIASEVSAVTGRQIELNPGEYYTAELANLDGFWPAMDDLVAKHEARPADEILRAQSP